MLHTAFVSTSIPYVNAKPHIGFALEIVQADTIARYLRLMGYETFFLTGTDENSLKNVRAAHELGIATHELCERHSAAFQALIPTLRIAANDFIRTSSDARHIQGAQKLWLRTRPEDIYRSHYTGLYCVGCEDFYSQNEAPEGVCPEHHTPLETVDEENYFFRLSAYQDQLHQLIESDSLRIVPDSRRNETLAFIESGLKDFSISRSRERAGNWGIPVPGDPTQVMYVWYDALSSYVTALDYATEGEYLHKHWYGNGKRIHVIGKDINRFHTLYWPAMLMSAGLPTPDVVFVHGFLTINGQKISKSLGNVIDPLVVVEKYGVSPLRYYLLRALSPFEDGDFNEERFRQVYNADLANNLGNLVRRIETIGQTAGYTLVGGNVPEAPSGFHMAMEEFRFNDALAELWSIAMRLNQRIETVKPWEMLKSGKKEDTFAFLDEIIAGLRCIAFWLVPFLPDTAKELSDRFAGGKGLKCSAPLFPRLR